MRAEEVPAEAEVVAAPIRKLSVKDLGAVVGHLQEVA